MKKLYYLLVLCFLLPAMVISQSSKKEKKELRMTQKFEDNKQALEAGIFSFSPRYRISRSGKSRLRGNYYVILREATGEVELLQDLSIDKDAIYLETGFDVEAYNTTYKDRGATMIASWKMRHKGHSYDFDLSITREKATLRLNGTDRSEAFYEGTVTPKK